MAEEKRPFLTLYQATKAYHRPGWAVYAEQVDAERREREAKAPVVLKVKRMNAGSIHYTFSKIQKKNKKPYLHISAVSHKFNYRRTIDISSPYVPAFLGIIQELSKEFEV